MLDINLLRRDLDAVVAQLQRRKNPQPFLDVAHYLNAHGQRAPQIYAEDAAAGWILIEDFGNDRMRDWLDDNPQGELGTYRAAIDALVDLHRQPSGPFAPYDMAVYQREAALLTEWYCPAMGLEVDATAYARAWDAVLAPLLERQNPGVTVLRDYHAENIMLLGPAQDGAGAQGLIDFQDALVGHPAYDLVSLLQDARRDVSETLERTMLDYYQAQADCGPEFEADYARLGAQRNAKIVGIFTRLNQRDGKPHYLDFIPRGHTIGQSNPRSQSATSVVHFGLRQVERIVPFDIARTHVIANGESDNFKFGG